ncbi:MAG: exopolyphosphatase [Thermoanaerobaculia bacterium]|nr:exopolyphosphatase [Thermoanaerobaculia bacterium]
MRLVTRADLDGLACALILTDNEDFDEIVLVHPQEITDKAVEILPDDTLANVPYHPNCGRWFDHHLLTGSNETPPDNFDGLHRVAPSAAQLVWEYFDQQAKFTQMVEQTNRFDSGQLAEEDVLRPQGWILLGFTVDPRTGHGDHEAFFHQVLDWLKEHTLREVLLKPEVRSRITAMFEQNEEFCWELMQRSRLDGNVVFTDFRGVKKPTIGNRFLVYTLFPEANVSVRAQFSHAKDCVMLNVGHSIFNRTCNVSVGELMSDYGGGGHYGAGSTPLPIMDADRQILEIIDSLRD